MAEHGETCMVCDNGYILSEMKLKIPVYISAYVSGGVMTSVFYHMIHKPVRIIYGTGGKEIPGVRKKVAGIGSGRENETFFFFNKADREAPG